MALVHTETATIITDLILEVFRLNGLLIAEGDRLTAPFSQSSSRWQVMGAIATHPLTVPAIGRRMGLSRQSVQRTVNLLHADGLIELANNPDHKRAPLITLTTKGANTLKKITKKQMQWVNQLSEGISETQAKRGLALVQQLRKQLDPDFKKK